MRYFIEIDDVSGAYEISCDCGGVKLAWELSENGVYYKQAINGDFVLYNNAMHNTFDAVMAMDDCVKATITIYDGNVLFCSGYFYKRNCEVNEDKCELKVKLTTIDKYTYLEKIEDIEYNLLAPNSTYPNLLNWHMVHVQEKNQYQYTTISGTWTIMMELNDGTWESIQGHYNAIQMGVGSYAIGRESLIEPTTWSVYDTKVLPLGGTSFHLTTTWVREVRLFIRLNNEQSETPPNQTEEDGWILIEGFTQNYGDSQYDMWARPVQGISEASYTWENVSSHLRAYLQPVGEVLTTSAVLRQGLLLNDAIEYILKHAEIDFTYESEFFTSVENPIDSSYNLSALMLIQKTLAADPGASDLPTRGVMTWKNLMTGISSMFQVYPYIDENNVLHLEHIKYYTNDLSYTVPKQEGQDLTACNPIALEYTNKYSYVEDIPIHETFSFQEATDPDFIGCPIDYSACVMEGEDTEYSASIFTTQCDNALLSGISDKDPNWMLLQTTDSVFLDRPTFEVTGKDGIIRFFVGLGYHKVINAAGKLTGIEKPNCNLSWANLHEAFWKINRPLASGIMNLRLTNFTKRKSRIQKNIIISLIAGTTTQTYDVENWMQTSVGSTALIRNQGEVRGQFGDLITGNPNIPNGAYVTSVEDWGFYMSENATADAMYVSTHIVGTETVSAFNPNLLYKTTLGWGEVLTTEYTFKDATYNLTLKHD